MLSNCRDSSRTPLGNAIFASPGSFNLQGLQQKLGFNPADIDVYLQAWNFTGKSPWTMNIIHGIKPLARDAIVAALEAQGR